jgi:hypothetical protein
MPAFAALLDRPGVLGLVRDENSDPTAEAEGREGVRAVEIAFDRPSSRRRVFTSLSVGLGQQRFGGSYGLHPTPRAICGHSRSARSKARSGRRLARAGDETPVASNRGLVENVKPWVASAPRNRATAFSRATDNEDRAITPACSANTTVPPPGSSLGAPEIPPLDQDDEARASAAPLTPPM